MQTEYLDDDIFQDDDDDDYVPPAEKQKTKFKKPKLSEIKVFKGKKPVVRKVKVLKKIKEEIDEPCKSEDGKTKTTMITCCEYNGVPKPKLYYEPFSLP